MATFVPIIFLILYVALFIIALRLRSRNKVLALTLFLIPVATLIIENALVIISSRLEASPISSTLNNFNLFLQALAIPVFAMVAFELARRADISWAQSSWVRTSMWLIVILITGYGLFHQYSSSQSVTTEFAQNSTLPFEEENSAVNLTVTEPSYASALLTALLVTMIGAFVFRALRWPWMLYGAACMLILTALPAEHVGVGYAAMGKLAISIALLLTAFRLYVLDPSSRTTQLQQAPI